MSTHRLLGQRHVLGAPPPAAAAAAQRHRSCTRLRVHGAAGASTTQALPTIKVIGVGGGGSQAVHRLRQLGQQHDNTSRLLLGVIDTDAQALARSPLRPQHRLHIGGGDSSSSSGSSSANGVRSPARAGREAATRSFADISAAVQGCDVVFVLAGLDGGTGAGAAPLVAAAAQQQGALTIAVATTPTSIAGRQRCVAQLASLRAACDGLITIPSHKLLACEARPIASSQAYETGDRMTAAAVQAIADLTMTPANASTNLHNLRALFSDTADSFWVGHGSARGPDRAVRATLAAMASPLQTCLLCQAGSVLFEITAPASLSKAELHAAVDAVRSEHHPAARVLFGAVATDDTSGRVSVTIVASGPNAQTAVGQQGRFQGCRGAATRP